MYPQKSKILVCDDSKISRQIIARKLKESGFNCIKEVDSAEKILEIVMDEESLHHYDLLLLDITMPGMKGTDLVEKIRNSKTKYKDIGIIMISAESEKATIYKTLKNGANDFILKPLDSDILIMKMLSVWRKIPIDLQQLIIERTKEASF